MHTNRNIQHVIRTILIAFFLTALALVFWSIVRADDILTRADNPRQVDATLAIERGKIFDRNSTLIAETDGINDDRRRYYPYPEIGPAVGYYSFRHGTDGVEDTYDAVLRGENEDFWQAFMRESLHEPQIGQNIRLTLDVEQQLAAAGLMKNNKGALVLFAQDEGAADILALVSHPDYDPNQLRETFPELVEDEEAPLLNRITQGQYQPGPLVQPFILAYAVGNGLLDLSDAVAHPDRPVLVNETATYCATRPPEAATWQDVLRHRCPGPMLDLAETMTPADLNNAFTDFKLTSQPQLPLNTETASYPPLADVEQALIGQDNLIVTPLQVAHAWLALNDNGRFPTLRLVSHIQSEAGVWEPVIIDPGEQETAVSPDTAAKILQSLPQTDNIVAFSTLVLSGPEGTINTWYLGAAPNDKAVVIVLEDTADLEIAEKIGKELLTN